MEKVRGGNLDPLGLLFERYHEAVFSFFVHTCADRAASQDLVQDVFYRIIKYRKSYRIGAAFKPWLYRIARNVRADHLKKQPIPAFSTDGLSDKTHPRQEPVLSLEQHEREEVLHRALRRLPEAQRELLILSHLEQLSYTELALVFDISINAARIRVCRALQAFREVYTNPALL